jgi:hypothetical protein
MAAGLLTAAEAASAEETYQKDATEEANLDVGAVTDSDHDGVPALDLDLAAVPDSDRAFE